MYRPMSFPKREWNNAARELKNGCCSTTRSCNELGKYKVGNIYETPWGDLVKIIKVTRFSKAEDIPTWNQMDKGMKISVKKGIKYGNSQWDYVTFAKIE
jgi:hypothetical protein